MFFFSFTFIHSMRYSARGDWFDPNQPNEKFFTNRYNGVVTHPTPNYTKTKDYPHGPLVKPSKDLLWC